MYRALMRFADLQDGNRIYEAGEIYPRPDFNVSPERIAELAGSDNRMGYPLIAVDQTANVEDKAQPRKKPQGRPRSRQKG